MSQQFRQTLALGAMAGMRSMSAPATISHALSKNHSNALADSPLRFMQSPTTAKVLKALAVAEVGGDKLPGMPDRTILPILSSRSMSGALVGAVAYKAKKGNVLVGALLGSAMAIAASYGALYLRKTLRRTTGLPDTVWALLEDGLVLKSATAVAADAHRSTSNQL